MADPQPNREPKNLVQPDQGKPDADGGNQGAAAPTGDGPATPPPAPRPGVDTGGVPNQPMVPSGPHGAPAKNGGRGAGQPHDKSAPESNPSGTSPSNAPTSAGGSALDTPDTSRPPVDTGAVGKPLPESGSGEKQEPASPTSPSSESGGQPNGPTPDEPGNQSDPGQPDVADEPDQSDQSDPDNAAADEDEQALAEQAEQEQGLAGAESGGRSEMAAGGEAAEASNAAEGAKAKAIVMNPVAWGAVALSIIMLLLGLLFVIVIIGISGSGTGSSSNSSGSGSSGGGSANCGQLSGTPKNVIDKVALPIAHKIAFENVTVESVETSNAGHGPTSTGGTSDHQGPPEVRWAADISNGTSPTPEMDKLAKDLAECFEIPWSGSGAPSHSKDGFRMQLIYRSMTGGNHFNHVHIGVAKG